MGDERPAGGVSAAGAGAADAAIVIDVGAAAAAARRCLGRSRNQHLRGEHLATVHGAASNSGGCGNTTISITLRADRSIFVRARLSNVAPLYLEEPAQQH